MSTDAPDARVPRGPLGDEPPAGLTERRHLDRELGQPAEERPHGPADGHVRRVESEGPEGQAPQDRDHIEHRGGKGRGAEALLRVQHPHGHRRERDQGQERHHDARQEDRELGLAGDVVEAGGQQGYEGLREDDARGHQHAQDRRQQRQQPGDQAMGLRAAALLQGPRVGRDEGGGERPLREHVAQQVRDPEGDQEGVGLEAGSEEGGEDLLAHEAEQARDEGQGGDEAGRPGQAGGARRRLDLGAQSR
jgi:hypothetical protein